MCGMTGARTLVGLTRETAFCYIPHSEPSSRGRQASVGIPWQQDFVNPIIKLFYDNTAKQMFSFILVQRFSTYN